METMLSTQNDDFETPKSVWRGNLRLMRKVGPDSHTSQEHEYHIIILICGHLAQDPYFGERSKCGARFELRFLHPGK